MGQRGNWYQLYYLLFAALEIVKNIKKEHKLSVSCQPSCTPQRKGESHSPRHTVSCSRTLTKVASPGRLRVTAMRFDFCCTVQLPEDQQSPEESLCMEVDQRSDTGMIHPIHKCWIHLFWLITPLKSNGITFKMCYQF